MKFKSNKSKDKQENNIPEEFTSIDGKKPKKGKEEKLSKKEEKLKKEEAEFKAKVMKAQKEQRITFILLDLLLDAIQNDIDNFVPSIGSYSMSDIDKKAKDFLDKLFNSREVKVLYKDKERKLEIKPVFYELRKKKPTKWETEAYTAYNIVRGKAKAIRNMPEEAALVKQVEQIFKWN